WKWRALKAEPRSIPIPAFPLKGKELTTVPQRLASEKDSNLINGRISGQSVEQTRSTQTLTSLDFRLHGNDVTSFAENEIDTPINATSKNQTTSRAGATRHVSDTTTANSAGYTRPTTPDTTRVHLTVTEHTSARTLANPSNEPSSRHSREGGNPESFFEQATPIEAPLNSLPLKGKELTTVSQVLTAPTSSDVLDGRIPGQSVEQTRSTQSLTSLDSHLRGNDASSVVENEIDTPIKTIHQIQTTSRAGATRDVSDSTTANSAGYTRPTTPEPTQDKSTKTEHTPAITQKIQTKETSATSPREGVDADPLIGQASGIKNEQANTSNQTTAPQEPTQARHDHLKARLPQRLARALLQADLRELDDVWGKLINEYADLFAQSLHIYLKKTDLRQTLIAAHAPEKMLESLQVLSPSVSQLLRECWDSWPIFSGFVSEKNKRQFQHRSLSLVWDALFDADLATHTKLAQGRQLVALLLPQPSSQNQIAQSSQAASQYPNYLTQIARLHHRLSASTAPLWHKALTQILTMDSRIAEIAALDSLDMSDEDVSLISHEEIRQSLLMELSLQDSAELHIAATWFEQKWRDVGGEPSPAPAKIRTKSLATYLDQEHAEQSATTHIDHTSTAQEHDHLDQLILLTQTTRTLSTAEQIHLRSLYTNVLSNAINNQNSHTRLQQELHVMLAHDAVIDRLCLCLNDVTLERIFVFLHADLLAPAKQIAFLMQSVFAIELCDQAEFFHVQAWRQIYRAANNISREEIALPSTMVATSPRARQFQAALMTEIAAHYALGSVNDCSEKIRQASVAEAVKINQTQAQTPAQQQTQATRPTKKITKPIPEPEQGEVDAYVLNAGMVIIAPYVQRLFGMLALTRDGAFVDEDAAQRAVHLLQYIVTGESATPEYQLSLNKLLCGIHGGVPIVAGIEITEHEKEVIAQMLQGVIAHWSALGNTSIDGLRQTFFARQGQLRHEEDAWHLQIPQSTFDMLLDRLPWSFAMIKFPWMPEPLHVSWRT
ncbi:MAG: hypothetical protein HY253_14260, partial [Burkholderiales bacterium]|nr:hypothetical protein [Burkholderiales bacterium]